MKRIAVLDGTFTMRKRIKELASRVNIEVEETSTAQQLIHLLHGPHEIGLIITELEFPDEDGFEVFSKIKSCSGQIPVMILTSENRRSSFLRGIRMGATDYVLKPFDSEFLSKKIVDILYAESVRPLGIEGGGINKGIPEILVDFNSYLNKELKKASKGNYCVSVLISLISDVESERNPIQNQHYHQFSSEIYQHLNDVIFETDVLMRYGVGSYVGIFPFCGLGNQGLIDTKFQQVFQELKEKRDMDLDTVLINSFAAYPEDALDQEELMHLIEERLTDSIRQMSDGQAMIHESESVE